MSEKKETFGIEKKRKRKSSTIITDNGMTKHAPIRRIKFSSFRDELFEISALQLILHIKEKKKALYKKKKKDVS